jgi:hypothetical protein
MDETHAWRRQEEACEKEDDCEITNCMSGLKASCEKRREEGEMMQKVRQAHNRRASRGDKELETGRC